MKPGIFAKKTDHISQYPTKNNSQQDARFTVAAMVCCQIPLIYLFLLISIVTQLYQAKYQNRKLIYKA